MTVQRDGALKSLATDDNVRRRHASAPNHRPSANERPFITSAQSMLHYNAVPHVVPNDENRRYISIQILNF